MKNVLFIHQSGELYGSDKTLLFLLKKLDRKKFSPIVMIPFTGPLVKELDKINVPCHVVPIIKLKRSILTISGILSLPQLYRESLTSIDRVLKGVKIDLVHSNTLAVLSGALWAKKNRVPHLWHVHEMILKPWWVKRVFGWLLAFYADIIICNSKATKELILKNQKSIEHITKIIWNGIEKPTAQNEEDAKQFRQTIGVHDDKVLFTLVGRINRWKGQTLFVEAAEQMVIKYPNQCMFLIVGSPPPEQEVFLDELKRKIDFSPAKKEIVIRPFTKDIWPVWAATDIAVVPSIEPEPFGLVALEAMALAKPVIAANHGGLSEIVHNNETGLLCDPNSVASLVTCMSSLMQDKGKRTRMGENGMKRFEEKFALMNYVNLMEDAYDKIISSRE